MLARIRHRGPDGLGTFAAGRVALGAVRLAVVDLTSRSGEQPFVLEDGAGVLAYNGELYNAAELRQVLMGVGAWFIGHSDTEVVARAVAHYGVLEAVDRFRGMFAFAYLDRHDDVLWLARDRLGIKPLYVTTAPNGDVVFGSELKGVIVHPAVSVVPSNAALIAHLLRDYLEGEQTPFSGIDAVRPGTVLRIATDRVDQLHYFDLTQHFDSGRYRAGLKARPGDTVADVEAELRDSITRHLVADAPRAVFCSGGLDSSLLAAIAHESVTDVVGYVADVVGAKRERERAERVARHVGLELRHVPVTDESFLRDWPLAIWHNDQPSMFSSDPAFLAVARACRDDGVKVVLTGEGADELFCGYPWLTDAFHLWRRAKWQHRLRLDGRLQPLLQALAPLPEAMRLSETFENYPLDAAHRWTRRAVVLSSGEVQLRQEDVMRRLADLSPPEERALLAASLNSMYGHLSTLLQRNDRMGMAMSVEARVPFLGDEFVDVAMHLPVHHRYRRGVRKWALKQVAQGLLPREVISAPKWGFATSHAPVRRAAPLLRGGYVPELLQWSASTTERFVESLPKLPKPLVLYALVGLELWSRLYVGGDDPEALGELLVASASPPDYYSPAYATT